MAAGPGAAPEAPGTREEALLDYRRQVAALYQEVRASVVSPEATLSRFRAGRDALFASHPQSALGPAERSRFTGLRYFPHEPALRITARLEPLDEPPLLIDLPAEGPTRLRPCGQVRFRLAGRPLTLTVFWVEVYGGGLFLPFRDATSGAETYGGGRYLLDTVKHADLGHQGPQLVIDFNYAYNPSCAYDSRWVCPLAPRQNQLPVPIRAGELAFHGAGS